MAGGRAIVVGQIGRKLSVASVRAQWLTLHGRLELIGTGLPEAAARRAAALAMMHTMEQDRLTFLQTICGPQHRVRRELSKLD